MNTLKTSHEVYMEILPSPAVVSRPRCCSSFSSISSRFVRSNKKLLALMLLTASVCSVTYAYIRCLSSVFEPLDELEEAVQSLPISNMSFVYTWVNGSDPARLQLKELLGGSANPTLYDSSIDELMYSLRSVEKYLPWHAGDIYIVTPGQVPNWLDSSHPRIHIIDQSTLLPPEANPSCNSFLLEFYLDRIPGLTEQFLYINDDFFFTRYTPLSRFVNAVNQSMLYPNGDAFSVTERFAEISAKALDQKLAKLPPGGNEEHWELWHASMLLTAAATRKKLGIGARSFWHVPFAWHKEILAAAREDFASYLKVMYDHPFRNQRDIQAPSIIRAKYEQINRLKHRRLYQDVPTGQTTGFALGAGCYDDDEEQENKFREIRSGKYEMFNMNADYFLESSGKRCRAFLEELYDTPSSFERRPSN